MPGEDIYSWSVTAANNGNSDSAIEWREGQTRASVNNSSRSEMAAIAKHRKLTDGSITTTNTVNAYAFTSGIGYTTVPTGIRVTLKIGTATNTASATLNMDGIGDVTIKTDEGANLLGGELVANAYTDFLYDGANWIFLYSRAFLTNLINGGDGVIIGSQIFAAAGTFTYTPTVGMECCIIECVGGGGGGGDASASFGSGQLYTGGGGGSGGYSRKIATATTIGVSQPVVVGAGGVGQWASPGSTGGVSSVGTLCIAYGGGGGTSTLIGASTPIGGAGGAPGTGDIAAAGSPGEQGGYASGSVSPINIMGGGGRGGSSYFGGGGQIPPVGLVGAAAGGAAGNYGSGGSGAVSNQAGGFNGAGAGSAGVVIITEFAGRGTPGRDGADGAPGPIGPTGPSGPGTGDVLRSGTPTTGQIAVWTDASHVQGVAPASLIIGFSTGDAKLTLKTTADAGWVMMNDGSIGDASSSATTLASVDCLALFTLLWTNIPDAWATVSGGRGASAAADWAAHKRIQLTRQLGRTLGIAGAGSGLTNRALGSFVGEEGHLQTLAEMPSHQHTFRPAAVWGAVQLADYGAGFYVYQWIGGDAAVGLTDVAGSGAAANVMQPTSFWNIMIKL